MNQRGIYWVCAAILLIISGNTVVQAGGLNQLLGGVTQPVSQVTAGLLGGATQVTGGLLANPDGGGNGVVPVIQPPSDDSVTAIPVSFRVRNVNRTLVLGCPADGKQYTLRGQIVAPAGHIGKAATLYLHGLGYGNFFWRFQAVPNMDFAVKMAELGHTSVVIDRIGYDSSDHPNGLNTCTGAQADMTHQIIRQLHAGTYQVDPGAPRNFDRIALAGHSAGGQIAEIEAYSFGGIDALAVLSYADSTTSVGAVAALAQSDLACSTGGNPAEPGEPSGYALFGQTDQSFKALNFADVAPDVADAATALRNRDPCGDFLSLAGGIGADLTQVINIHVPVLELCGLADGIFPPPACQLQSKLFLGSTDVTGRFLKGIGHALTLSRRAPAFRKNLSDWLNEHNF